MGPAVTARDFVERLTLPHGYGGVIGFCGAVAEAGFALGGGLGLQSRLYGLGADSVVRMRVVLADGSVVVASNDDDNGDDDGHADLYWALRGAGGGSFGVVTSMEYRIHPMSESVYYTGLLLAPETAASVAYQLGDREESLPGNLIVMIDDYSAASGTMVTEGVGVNLFWSGRDKDEANVGEAFLADLVHELLEDNAALNISSMVFSFSEMYLQSQQRQHKAGKKFWSGDRIWAAQTWTGFLYPVNNTADVWNEIMQVVANGVSECSPYLTPDIEFWGGAIHETSNSAVFPHREAVWNVGVLLVIPEDEENADAVWREHAAKVEAWWPRVSRYLTGSYVNYPMVSLLENQTYARAFWGDNLPRLVGVKQRYDPDNVFNFPMSVPMELVH